MAFQGGGHQHASGSRHSQWASNAASAAEGRAVYLRGIPPTWTSSCLQDFLGTRWPVESINLLPAKSTQRTRAAFVNFWSGEDAAAAEKACDGEVVEDEAGNTFWLGCSLKRDARARVDVSCQDYSKPTEILTGFLFLGNRQCANNASELARLGIDRVVTVMSESEEAALAVPSSVRQLRLQAEDAEEEDLARLFGAACGFLEEARAAGSRVLVHCVAGRSRSVTIVLAYLIRHERMTLDDAFALVKDKRPFVRPNAAFWSQLQEEEWRLSGKSPLTAKPATRKPETTRGYGAGSGPPRASTSAQLAWGSLSSAPRHMLDDLSRDLGRFSAIHGAAARAEVCQDRIDVSAPPSGLQQGSRCLAELEEILAFYGFEQVQWSPATSTQARAEANVSRW